MQLNLNLDLGSSVGSLSSISALDNVPQPRHRWYFFKEAFSSEIVKHSIADAKLQSDDLVMDPFSGSGTVALEANMNGYRAIGYEVNPFLAFVSQTKLIRSSRDTIQKHESNVISEAMQGAFSNLEEFSTFTPRENQEKGLFNLDVLRAFEGGWQATESIYRPAKDLLRLALLGAAMDVCNATKDGKCLRYRKDWKERNFDRKDFVTAFRSRLQIIKSDLDDTEVTTKQSKIQLGDARQLQNLHDGSKFTLCVTSPPYLNSFDYTDIYRPELFLGKFVSSNKELAQLRMQTLRSHVQVNWALPQEKSFGINYDRSYEAILAKSESLWNKNIPFMIQAYFEDMKAVLAQLRLLAEDKASIWLIVSTSAYAGVEIPVDLILADIGKQVGWYLREVSVFRYLKRISGQQWNELSQNKLGHPRLRESIIIFDTLPRGRRRLRP